MPLTVKDGFFPRLHRQVERMLGIYPLRPRPIYGDDTFIVSFPRSGSNWLCRMIVTARFPEQDWDIDVQGRRRFLDVIPEVYNDWDPAKYPRPRVIKSHAPYQWIFPKTLYLYRDVRDVVVSYHNYFTTRRGYTGTLGDFLDDFITMHHRDIARDGRWDDHVKGWAIEKHRKPILALKYEAMFAEPHAGLETALDFLGYKVPQANIAAAVADSNFEKHKERTKLYLPKGKQGYEGGVKGGPGAGKETLTPEQLDRLWAEMGETMERLGYSR